MWSISSTTRGVPREAPGIEHLYRRIYWRGRSGDLPWEGMPAKDCMTTPSPPRIACIGAGYWGRNLVRNFEELGALEWVCEVDKPAREADRQKMAEMMGIDDQDVLEALQDLGYTSETIPLLHLVPLVEVAWSEGGVADREREMIFKIAEARGIPPDGVAHEMLSHWLENKPSDKFFDNSLKAIRVIFDLLPGLAGALLNFSDQLIGVAIELIEVVRAELTPAFFDPPSQLIPMATNFFTSGHSVLLRCDVMSCSA